MRLPLLAAALLCAALLPKAPALAQTERLPTRSEAERAYNELNRSTLRQNRDLNRIEQNQFETNSLRNDIGRGQQFPSVIGPQPTRPGCIGVC